MIECENARMGRESLRDKGTERMFKLFYKKQVYLYS